MDRKIRIFAKSRKQYTQAVYDTLKRGAYQAGIIYSYWMREGIFPEGHKAFKNCPSLYQEILDLTDFTLPKVIDTIQDDANKKLLVQFEDGASVESVLLSMKSGWTLCVSSQVGCRMGCRFCETAKMGLERGLTAAEIVSQVYLAKISFKVPVRNLVFMGMGEPLDNFEAVMQAIEVLTDQAGLAIGEKRITVSTSGLADKIEMLADHDKVHPCLAISINGPTDIIRQKLMPVNRRYPMERLKQSLEYYTKKTKKELFVEYVMLKGINDSVEDANKLVEFLEGLAVKVNLIPYNPQNNPRYMPSDEKTLGEFAKVVYDAGYRVLVRQNKGRKMMAACGQLGKKASRSQELIVN